MPIRCEVVSQDRLVYQGDVDIVNLPGLEGDMGIMPNHSPVLTLLRYGVISIKSKTEEQFFTVAGGVAEVQPDQVTILADAAENVDEIDIQRAESARKRAEEYLLKMPQSEKETEDFLAIQAALRRSNLRLDAARKFKTKKKSY
jgi:F-type H+-transporting ATPase subunit epsilon